MPRGAKIRDNRSTGLRRRDGLNRFQAGEEPNYTKDTSLTDLRAVASVTDIATVKRFLNTLIKDLGLD